MEWPEALRCANCMCNETSVWRCFESFRTCTQITWCFSDRASWIDYILITSLMHSLLFIHKILSPLHVLSLKCSSSGGYSCIHAAYGTATLYESSWWPVVTQLTPCTDRPPQTLIESGSTICCMYTTVSSWRWALEAQNM